MDDSQFKMLLTAIGCSVAVIGSAIRWGVNRVVAALDKNSGALLKHAEEAASLRTTMQFVYGVTSQVNERLIEESSGVHHVPTANQHDETREGTPAKRDTPAGGYSFIRATTKGDRSK